MVKKVLMIQLRPTNVFFHTNLNPANLRLALEAIKDQKVPNLKLILIRLGHKSRLITIS